MQVIRTQVLVPGASTWEASYLRTGEKLASLVEQPDGSVRVTNHGEAAIWFVADDVSKAQLRVIEIAPPYEPCE